LNEISWTIQGNPAETWQQTQDDFMKTTVIVSRNHEGDNILKQSVNIPGDATILRWNISTTKYGQGKDQENVRVSIKFADTYLLHNFDPPANLKQYTIEKNIISHRGRTGTLELIHHASNGWGTVYSNWVIIDTIPISNTGVHWKKLFLPSSPSPGRSMFQMVYEPLKKVMMLFGGSPTNDQGLNDMWVFNGKTWEKVIVKGVPESRYGYNMVYAEAGNKIVLFGGELESKLFNDTWEFNCSNQTWNLVKNQPAPPARAFFAMAYDSSRRKVILFGGNGGKRDLGDTWEYDCNPESDTFQHWEDVSSGPSASPASRQNANMVYDAFNKVIVLFGGFQQYSYPRGCYYNDTWVWDGRKWDNSVADDPEREPSQRCSNQICFDPHRRKVILFGGYSSNSTENDLWEYSTADRIWKKIITLDRPELRAFAAMKYFPERQAVILFGGSKTGMKKLNDTWELTTSSYRR
jgi:hypothetical protein